MTVDETEDSEPIELAAAEPKRSSRRVATAAGAAYYGQPIGTVITPDDIAAAKSRNEARGVTASSDMLDKVDPKAPGSAAADSGAATHKDSSGGALNAASPLRNPSAGNSYTQRGYAAPNIDSSTDAPAMPADGKLALSVGESTINGPEKFKVGDSQYSAPEGSKMAVPKSGDNVVVIVTPDNAIHFFTNRGEVEMQEIIKELLLSRFSDGVRPDDTLYKEGIFESAPIVLSSITVGQSLCDSDGVPMITRTSDGFVLSALELPLDEADVEELVALGGLELSIGEAAPEASLFVGYEIDSPEAANLLYASAAPGTEVSYSGIGGEMEFTLTLSDEGVWLSNVDYIEADFELPIGLDQLGKYTVTSLPTEEPVELASEDPEQVIAAGVANIAGIPEVQLREAVDTLLAHTHGSPLYGLNSLPEENEVKRYSERIIAAAEQTYSSDTPKQATIKFLQSFLPETDSPELPEGPVVHIGAESPAKNAFGVTGGDFHSADIAAAVAIIEAYSGKLFKSQLTNKGNPLGTLDFNALVGKNSDKLQQKADVIAYLRALLI